MWEGVECLDGLSNSQKYSAPIVRNFLNSSIGRLLVVRFEQRRCRSTNLVISRVDPRRSIANCWSWQPVTGHGLRQLYVTCSYFVDLYGAVLKAAVRAVRYCTACPLSDSIWMLPDSYRVGNLYLGWYRDWPSQLTDKGGTTCETGANYIIHSEIRI